MLNTVNSKIKAVIQIIANKYRSIANEGWVKNIEGA